MSAWLRRMAFGTVMVLALGSATLGQNTPKDPVADVPPKAADDDALEVKAVLAPARSTNVMVEIKAYAGELRVRRMVEPGTRVKAGDVLVELDAPDFARALENATANAEAAVKGNALAELNFKNAESGEALRMARLEFEAKSAEAELAAFRGQVRDDRIAQGVLSLKQWQARIADEEDELNQLNALYKGNDLAKESQDIVLNRAKRGLETMREQYRLAQRANARMVQQELPEHEARLVLESQSKARDLENARKRQAEGLIDSPMGEMHAMLIRSRQSLRETQEFAARLRGEASALNLTAPHDGIAVVGAVEGNDGVSQSIKVGDKVNPRQVLAGVVVVDRLRATFNVPVARLSLVGKVGDKLALKSGDAEIAAVIQARGFLAKDGKVAVVVEIDNTKGSLLAGQDVLLNKK